MQVSCDHPETMEQEKYISFIAGVTKAAYNFFRRKLSEQVGLYFYCGVLNVSSKLDTDLTCQLEELCIVNKDRLYFEPIRF